jgi:uncharacterized protein (DUF924 family)
MRGFSSQVLVWLIGGLLQLMPFLLHAQAEMMSTGPMVPEPIPPAPMGIIPPAVTPPPVSPFGAVSSVIPPSHLAAPPPGTPPQAKGSAPMHAVPSQASPDMSQAPMKRNPIIEILDFWFGFLPGPNYFPQDKMPIWFASSPEIDRQIRDIFGQDLINAERGEYNHWRDTPRGRLALILLLDQIPRHIYRKQPQEFMFDRMARALVIEGIQKGDDKRLYPIERAFFYLPLEHAEDLQMQNLSVASYQQLLATSPEALKPQMQDFLQAAIMHQQQIARFGRFPYRNAILGRASTPEETVFLMQWKNR